MSRAIVERHEGDAYDLELAQLQLLLNEALSFFVYGNRELVKQAIQRWREGEKPYELVVALFEAVNEALLPLTPKVPYGKVE